MLDLHVDALVFDDIFGGVDVKILFDSIVSAAIPDVCDVLVLEIGLLEGKHRAVYEGVLVIVVA